ncbi:MAG: hypothetical protein AABX66_00065 [Nanoarchaeota archaeon]
MGFGTAISRAWKEYKLNFVSILTLVLVFSVVPLLIVGFIGHYFVPSELINQQKEMTTKLQSFNVTEANSLTDAQKQEIEQLYLSNFSLMLKMVPFFIIMLVLYILMFLFYFFGVIGLIKSAFRSNFNFSDAIRNAKRLYWKALRLIIVECFFVLVIGLVVLLIAVILKLVDTSGILLIIWIILSICFFVWFLFSIAFSIYILVDEEGKVWSTLKKSFILLRGKWWITFAKTLLFVLFSILFYTIVGALVYFLFNEQLVISVLGSLIVYPIGILFYKNLYLELKSKSR